MERVPDFAGDEEVFSFDDSFGDFGGDRVPDFVLVLVAKSAIDVTISRVDCRLNKEIESSISIRGYIRPYVGPSILL